MHSTTRNLRRSHHAQPTQPFYPPPNSHHQPVYHPPAYQQQPWQMPSQWTDDKDHMQSFVSDTLWRAKRLLHRWTSTTLSITGNSPHHKSSHPPSQANLRFILLCCLWYTTSALSSNTGKSIMQQFRYPVTLTFVQFGFVAGYCLLCMTPVVRFTRMRAPTHAIIQSTLPMGVFQVGGHIFSSIAISRIPVSTVHTIKALSPLFTVAAYALLFGVSYSAKTYIALLPLTIGVMLACSFDMSASNAIGLLCAFGSALVFVSSNIFFKKIMPSNSSQTSHKLDKLNLLLYSSSMAFILMIPVWMYYDLPIFLSGSVEEGHDHRAPESSYSVAYYFFLNGTVHFAQNLIAFIILSSTSPVTYSIASLVKRVAVICIAIVWFKQTVHVIQGLGIVMTFLGLHMYNNAKGDVEKGEKKMRRVEAARDMMLPSTKEDAVMMGTDVPPVLDLHAADAVATAGLGPLSRTRGHASGMSSRFQPLVSAKSVDLHASSPTLTIEVSQAALSSRSGQKYAASPIESYPSPPLSLDSPPSPHRAFEPIEVR